MLNHATNSIYPPLSPSANLSTPSRLLPEDNWLSSFGFQRRTMSAPASLSSARDSSPLLFDSILLCLIRAILFLACRRFLKQTLSPALRRVSKEDESLSSSAGQSGSSPRQDIDDEGRFCPCLVVGSFSFVPFPSLEILSCLRMSSCLVACHLSMLGNRLGDSLSITTTFPRR